MKIAELQARQGNVNIELDIVSKEQPREFEKFGKPGRVCNAQGKDEAGSTIKITLWNEQIDQMNEGDKVKLENGYVGEWQGELQLSAGKFGKFEVIGKAEAGESAPTEPLESISESETAKEGNEKELPAVDDNVEEEKIE